MDAKLLQAIAKIHAPADWVHLATVGRDGSPHVTPMMMGVRDPYLLFSLTGKQKVRNMERDPRACVAISKPVTMAHVMVWGNMAIRIDAEAQRWWNELISGAFGPGGLGQRNRALARDGTVLGVFTPSRQRIYGID